MRQPTGKNPTFGNHRTAGFLFIELAIALATVGIIVAGLAMSMDGLRRFNHYQLTRQQCIAAAQAQLDSMTATGKRIGRADIERLWPGVELEVLESPGKGQWSRLTLVRVVAKAQSINKDVEIRQRRYIAGVQSESENR